MQLLVSHDLGLNYELADSGESEQLLKQGKNLDEEGLRWVITDEDDKVLWFSYIHTQTAVATLMAGGVLLTSDQYMMKCIDELTARVRKMQ